MSGAGDARPGNAALLGVLATLAVTSAALVPASLRTFERFRPAWNIVPPPLGVTAPPAESRPQRRARRVLFALLDGLRLDAARDLPALRTLGTKGVFAEAVSEYPTSSLPNYAALATGTPPEITGILNNAHPGPFPFDTLAARAKGGGLRTALVGPRYSGMRQIDEPRYDIMVDLAPRPDLPAGDLVVFVTVEIDVAGHAFGGTSPEYRSSALHADRQLAALLAGLDLARDAVVVTADHGRVDFGGHGGLEPEVRAVPLVLAGAGVRPGAIPRGARVTDVPPTIAAMLGLAAPRQSTGRVLSELLDLPPDEAAEAARVDGLRRAALLERLDEWRSAHVALARRVRLGRLVALGATLLLVGSLARLARRFLVASFDGRAVLGGAGPYVATAALAGWAHGFHLSPSYGPPRSHLKEDAFLYGGLLLALAGAAFLAAHDRRGTTERLRWRAGAGLLGIASGLAVLGATQTFLWPPFATGVPSPAQVALVAIACASVAGAAAVNAAALVLDILLFLGRARP